MADPESAQLARGPRRIHAVACGALIACAAACAMVGHLAVSDAARDATQAGGVRHASLAALPQDGIEGPPLPPQHPARPETSAPSSTSAQAPIAHSQDDRSEADDDAAETTFESWQRAQMERDEQERSPSFRDRLSIDFSIDVTNAYFFRGLLQEKDDVIVQPALEFGYRLTEPNDVVDIDAVLGTWNSFHSKATGAGTSDDLLEHWYESDIYAGLRIAREQWSFTGLYYFYLSPSDAFDTVQEIELSFAYDDSPHWDGAFALNPELRLAFETSGAADGGERGIYLQLGVSPGMDWQVASNRTISLSAPVTLGLGLDKYYEHPETGEDDAFGYLDLGIDASTEIAPGATLSGGLHYLLLGDSARAFNGGSIDEIIGRIGVSFSF